eukprot:TRINITY_DN2424_c0_g1_i1.p1 TRINITY_DN2424_c0_g1~~TRINITY_DN2424_c0_g1_i1.p1  ORF type:complete len:145 (-),score=1.44 TRINITY_DN2424_c0_g1_i1:171-605(-)
MVVRKGQTARVCDQSAHRGWCMYTGTLVQSSGVVQEHTPEQLCIGVKEGSLSKSATLCVHCETIAVVWLQRLSGPSIRFLFALVIRHASRTGNLRRDELRGICRRWSCEERGKYLELVWSCVLPANDVCRSPSFDRVPNKHDSY